MKIILQSIICLVSLLLFLPFVNAEYYDAAEVSYYEVNGVREFGDLDVTGDVTLSGSSAKLSSENEQWNYMRAGAYLNNMTQCKMLIMWQNPSGGGTETDLCGSNTITYDAASDFTASDRVTQGLSWSLAFDGTDDRLTVTEDASLALGDGTNSYDFTIFFWFKSPAQGEGAKNLLYKRTVAAGNEFYIAHFNGGLKIKFIDDSAAVTAGNDISVSYFVEDTWYFVAVTHDEAVGSGTTFNDGTKVYVNGVDITLTDITQNCTTAAPCAGFVAIEDLVGVSLHIGADDAIASLFNKQLGDVGILWEVLTSAQIKSIYQSSRGFM